MYKILSEAGIPAVLSTWEGEPTHGLQVPTVTQKLPVELFGHYSEPSKFYQVSSFKAGLKYLTRVSEVTHVVKVRADVEFNVYDFCASLREIFLEDAFFLAVPYLDSEKAWSLQDFYWAGRTELMQRISEDFLSGPEVHKHVHQDFFWRFSSIALDSWSRAAFCRFGRPWTRSQWEQCVSRTMALRPMAREVWGSLIWRGHPVESGAQAAGSDARIFQREGRGLRSPKLFGDSWLTDIVFTDNLSESRNLDFRKHRDRDRMLTLLAKLEKAWEPILESKPVKRIAIQVKDRLFIPKTGL